MPSRGQWPGSSLVRTGVVGALGVALALLAAPSIARTAPTRPVTVNRLANGAVVVVRESHATAVVAAALMVRAGTRYENRDSAGLTNFLQRLLLRGTERYSAAALIEAAEEIGARLDAAGDVEHAEIHGAGPARHWHTLLTLITEVARRPTLPPGEIERERRLILSQFRTRAESPFTSVLDVVAYDVFAPHPYAFPTLGLRETIENADRDRLLNHYRWVYRPSRMVLSVSGAVDAPAVVRAAERLLGDIPGGEAEPPPPAPPAGPAGTRRVLQRPAQQAQVQVGFRVPGLGHPDYPATRVLGAALGGGMSSRLFVELRDRRGLAYSIGVLTPMREDAGMFVLHLGTAPENAVAAEEGLRGEVDRIRSGALSVGELARAKAYVLGTLAMDRRTNARQAWYLGFFELVGLGHDFADRYARAVEAVTADDVQRVAVEYLTRATTVVLQPMP
jgi:zinc protease